MSALSDPGRVVAVPLLVGLLVLNAAQLVTSEASAVSRAATAVAVAFYAVLAVQYLRRGTASDSDRRAVVWVVAVGATLSPFLIPLVGGPPPGGIAVAVGTVAVLVGTAGAVWSALSLGRSISVIPQARVLATTGPYRWLRHPLYVFEVVASAGVCTVTGGTAPWIVLTVLVGLQVVRARWEERLLARTLPGYTGYQERTVGLPTGGPRPTGRVGRP